MPFEKFKSIFGRGEDKSGKNPPPAPPVIPPEPPKDPKLDSAAKAEPTKPEAGKGGPAKSELEPTPGPKPEPAKPVALPGTPTKAEEKSVTITPIDEPPLDVKTLKLERSGTREETNPTLKPAVPSAEAKGQLGQSHTASRGDAPKKTPEPVPAVEDTAMTAPPPSPAFATSEPRPPAPAKTPLLAGSPAPTGLLALPTNPGESTAPPTAKPTDLTAPKAAQWKNLPAADAWCPAAVAEHYPELRAHVYEDNAAAECVLPSGWRVVGATKRGRQHAHKGTHREDAIAFIGDARFTILAVSDGAGSCPLSRLGSHIAVHTVTARLMDVLPKLDKAVTEDADKLKAELTTQLTAALVAACQALQDIAAKTKTSAKDYRCTLLTLLHWHGEKHELLLANQIGDGAILVLNKDKSTRRVGEPDSGQFSGEVSCFVPDDNARDKAKKIDPIAPVETVECVLLCTDGIEDPFFPIAKTASELFRQLYVGVTAPLKDFKSQPAQPPILPQESAANSWLNSVTWRRWLPILPQESAAGALGQWLEFEKRGENDDRSVLILHRRPPTVTF